MFFWLLIAIFLGLIFGSFGSVILSRRGESETLKQASSILRGRSQCPHCKTLLQPRDLVPLLSFFLQKGKCRYCKKSISWLYPILELGSALIFGFVWRYFSGQGREITLFWTMSGRMLWLLVLYDVLWYELHLPLLLAVNGVLLLAMGFGLFSWGSLRGGLIFFLVFLFLYWIARWRVERKYHTKEEGIWMGDVLIAPYVGTLFFAGLSVSLEGLDKVLAVLYFFVLSGSIGILWYFIQNKRYGKKACFLGKAMAENSLPFIPAMLWAVILLLVFQEPLFWLYMW